MRLPLIPGRARLLALAMLVAFSSAVAAQDDRPPPLLHPGFSHSLVVGGLGNPTAMELAPDGRWFVAEKAGRVHIVKGGERLPTPFLTLGVDTFKDGGLTGITLDPAFTQNGFVYVFYSRLASPVRTRVSRFTASQSNPDIALTGSELILVDDIPADLGSHNGGGLRFGTDGKLYIGVGDGATDPMDAQRLDTLNGKLLRINADGSIPPDNPFVAEPGARPEIWAYGLRNPFTFAIQAGTGAILINDVGRGGWEEINLGAARANYGWPLCEGPCATPGLTDPIHAYPHGIGCALSGAAFYPGGPLPAKYAGAYVYADFMGGWISALEWGAGESTPLAAGLISPVGLSVGNDGALYYLSFTFGTINRIDYRPDAADEANAAGIPLEDLAARAFPCVE